MNGILTPADSASWGIEAEARFKTDHPELNVLYRHYWAGPVAPWTCWVRNPREARHLVNRLERLASEDFRLRIVAHSNGTNIAVHVMNGLAARGIRTDAAVLIGSALHSRVDRSSLLGLVEHGHLGRTVAYCDPGDRVTSRRREWVPFWWGGLGSQGFRGPDKKRFGAEVDGFEPAPESEAFVTRMFSGLGHNGYFRPASNLDRTLSMVEADLGLAV